MSRTKQRSQLTAIGDINMTPLIDLTFLLLIKDKRYYLQRQ